MASSLRMTLSPRNKEPRRLESTVPAALAAPARAYLARLATLHDEAAETAHLANLLGRAPWAAGALGVAVLANSIWFAQAASPTATLAWFVLTIAAVTAIVRAYGHAIRSPFDGDVLKGFTRNLSAILLFAGAVCGSGLFLVVPSGIGLAGSIAFTMGLTAPLAVILRTRDMTFCFLGPATMMGIFCALMRGLDGRATIGVLAGGVAVATLSVLWEHLATPAPRVRQGRHPAF